MQIVCDEYHTCIINHIQCTSTSTCISRVYNGRGRVSNEGIMLDTSARMFTSVYSSIRFNFSVILINTSRVNSLYLWRALTLILIDGRAS